MQRIFEQGTNPSSTTVAGVSIASASEQRKKVQAELAAIVARAEAAPAKPRPSPSEGPPGRLVEALAGLWQAMLGIFGHTWSSQYGISPLTAAGELSQAGKAWAEAVKGLTSRQLTAGVLAAQRAGHEFPPNAARFRALALDLPSLAEIEHELAPGQDRSSFAVLVWSFLDAYRYRIADGHKQQRMLRSAFEMATRHVLSGGKLPAPIAASIGYERPSAPTVADPARAREAMLRAARELGLDADGAHA